MLPTRAIRRLRLPMAVGQHPYGANEPMPLRKLVEGGSFAPEILAVIYAAFDLAWSDIAAEYGDDPARIEFARTRLAHAVLSAADSENEDPIRLKDAALVVLARTKQARG